MESDAVEREEQDAPSSTLIVASNRLPVVVRIEGEVIAIEPSNGGLAAALRGVAAECELRWIGWPGCVVDESLRTRVAGILGESRLTPVFLDAPQQQGYYDSLSNQAIWPLFHYFTERVDFQEEAWRHFSDVNQVFAETIAREAPHAARVWIHDFHLMLVPRLLRELRADLEIGFFLHIPFPSSEIYRLLPAREELLRGVLGADLIGFHTLDYVRHFRTTCVRVLGLETERDAVHIDGRRVALGGHPIGIDVNRFDDALGDERFPSRLHELRERYGDRRLVLGVERLDYTKGIAQKFLAFERLLEQRPDLVGDVTLLQVIVPSRLMNPDYAGLKRGLEEMVGRINGRFTRPGVTPIEYIHGSLEVDELAALYRFARVDFVTPLRDGMNLVAQEFVLCQQARVDLDPARGMLVLSEFAGAAQILPTAILVNPWNVAGMARALEAALEIQEHERDERMGAMAERVRDLDCHAWSQEFLTRLHRTASKTRGPHSTPLRGAAADDLVIAFHGARRRILFLDYDGTLRELTRTPEDAVPGPRLRELLRNLSRLPGTAVHVVSGRRRADLERWLGDLGVALCAEHGFAWRAAEGGAWTEIAGLDLSWIDDVERLLQRVCREVPGTRVERKSCALAWHYRLADPDYGPWRARELLSELESSLTRLPVEIVHGIRVVEVRPTGVHKGTYVSRVIAAQCDLPQTFLCAFGDDRTDQDMFRAMPSGSYVIQVGGTSEHATHSVATPGQVRTLLERLCPSRGA